MNIAEIICQSVTMTDICNKYGFSPNRAGFISCPFHNEKTASLKIYKGNKGWHCYGCGKGGSVIDFVMLYYGTDFKGALKAIDNDFLLGLFNRPTLSEYRQRQKVLKQRQDDADKYNRVIADNERRYQDLLNEWIRLDENKRKYAPRTAEEEWHILFVEALQKLPYQEYLLDCADIERTVMEIDFDRRRNMDVQP